MCGIIFNLTDLYQKGEDTQTLLLTSDMAAFCNTQHKNILLMFLPFAGLTCTHRTLISLQIPLCSGFWPTELTEDTIFLKHSDY